MNNITVRQIEFKSTNGRDIILGWIYTPGEEIRGVVRICHGMAEHMGRYHEFMRYLAQNGYVACGIDQLGHGRSAEESRYGFFADHDGWKRLIDDQYKFYKIVCSEIPDHPHMLLGHSMGSFVARLYAARYSQSLDGLLLIGTARGGLRIDLAARMAAVSVKKHGPMYRDRKLYRAVFGGFNDRVPAAKTTYDWLSRDAESVRQYVADPACGFILTSSGFTDLFSLMRGANEQKCFQSLSPKTPVLLLSGAMDPVSEYGKGVEQVYRHYIKAGVSDVEMVLYDGARHELMNESNRQQVWDELLAWLNDHVPAREQSPFEEET